jgi:tail tube protein
MSLVPTSSAKVTRQVQCYAETNGYGQQVTNPTLFNAGIISNVSMSVNVDHESVRIQGSRKQYADIQMGVEGTITLDYRLLDTKLIRYAITDPAGAGTIGESLAFIFARKINNTEEFTLAQGCIADSATINLDRVPTISQQFYASKISGWLTISQLRTALGLTGTNDPTWAAPLTADPWTHLYGTDGSSSAVTVNGSAANVTKMSVTVNNNLLKEKPLGFKNARTVEAGNKVVTVSIEPFLYDTTFYDLVNNFTLSTVVLRLKASTPVVDLTVTGCKFNSYDDKSDAAGNDFITTPVSGTAVDATITQYP